MSSTIILENNSGSKIRVQTEVNPALSSEYWGISSDAAPAHQSKPTLWMSRSDGITHGKTWVFTTSFTLDGVNVKLKEQLTGTRLSSDLRVKIEAGTRVTGWESKDTSLTFPGQTQRWTIGAAWISNAPDFDNLRFTVQPPPILTQIRHVVVLMMENRSLDNLLGWIYAPDNQPPNNIPQQSPTSYDGLLANRYSNSLSPADVEIYASEGTTKWGNHAETKVPSPDPGESFDQMTEQIFDGESTPNMGGFLKDYSKIIDKEGPAGTAAQIMQSYSPGQIPVITKLAKSFAVSDAWFASCPCQTWPNRGFVHTGSSDGHINNDDYEPYDIETIFNLLYAQDISWAVYNDTVAPSLVHTMFPKLWDYEEDFQSMAPFYKACRAGKDAKPEDKLPRYSFIEPNFLSPDQSYHPPHDVRPAEVFLQKVYTALKNCPYRDHILFVVTFDEHGGCYDHVPPPSGAVAPEPGAVSKDGRFRFDRFGVRVPTIVVSSYVTPGTVFRSGTGVPYDHTSILATLRDWLLIGASAFTAKLPSPRIMKAPNLEAVLTEKEPQSWPDIAPPSPPPAETIEAGDTPLDPLQQGVVVGEANLRAGRFIGRAAVSKLLDRVKTRHDAERYLAEVPPRKGGLDASSEEDQALAEGCRGVFLRVLGKIFARRR